MEIVEDGVTTEGTQRMRKEVISQMDTKIAYDTDRWKEKEGEKRKRKM